jgi:hypothetical protein
MDRKTNLLCHNSRAQMSRRYSRDTNAVSPIKIACLTTAATIERGRARKVKATTDRRNEPVRTVLYSRLAQRVGAAVEAYESASIVNAGQLAGEQGVVAL